MGLVLKNSAKRDHLLSVEAFEAPTNHSIRRFAAEGIIAPYPVLGTEPASTTAERIGMRGNKKCAPTFADTARKALDKAVCIIADGNAGYAAFGAMLVAWVAVMAVYACIG